MPITQSRRRFLSHAVTGRRCRSLRHAAGACGRGAGCETTTLRLDKRIPSSAVAPQYVAEALLRAEGFTEIHYIDAASTAVTEAVARGGVDSRVCILRRN